MMGAITRRLRSLGLMSEAFLAIAVARVQMRLWPVRTLSVAASEPVQSRETDVENVVRHFRSVVQWHPMSTSCLHRSLALRAMLVRRGAAARVRIGLGEPPQMIPGHAWVEVGGRVVNDDEAAIAARYRPLVIGSAAQ